jgi:hypothetical protein
MKNILFYLVFFFILISCSEDGSELISSNDAKQIVWVKTIGGSKNDQANSVVNTNDGGYAILGFTQSNDGDVTDKSNNSFDYWLIKYDINNQLEWSKTYGGSLDDRGNSLIQTQDGGFLITGESNSNDEDASSNSGLYDFWVIKINYSGIIEWEKSIGFSGSDKANSVIQTADNGFLVTGVLDVTASNGEGNTKLNRHAGGDYWAIRLSQDGKVLWSKYFGGSLSDTPYDAIETADKGFLLVGTSDSSNVDINNNLGSYDYWVVKIDAFGIKEWEKSFGGSEIDEAYGIVSTLDGNYVIVGNTRSNDKNVTNNNGDADLWLIKITPEGNLLWQKNFGGLSFEIGRSVFKTQDNGFLISGSSRSIQGDLTSNNGQNDAWVFKLDSNANLEWQKSIGGSLIDFALDAVELTNKDVIVVGYSSSSDVDVLENKGFKDLLIAKIK